MTWKGVKPVVKLSEKIYKKAVKHTKPEIKKIEQKIKRSKTLPKWDVIIEHLGG